MRLRQIRRPPITALIGCLLLIWSAATPVLAFCCKCTSKATSGNICLTDTTGFCGDILSRNAANKNLSSITMCDALDDAKCTPVSSGSGLCADGPTPASTYVPSTSGGTGTTAPVPTVCCSCTSKAGAGGICLTDTKGTCSDILARNNSNSALSAISSCSTLTDGCSSISGSTSASAQCKQGPVPAISYSPDTGSKATAAGSGKITSTISAPQIGINIPGLQFASNIPVYENQNSTNIPFLGQYIVAVYNYLLGIVVIAAAIMIVYGGFKYILSSSLEGIKGGKDIVTDATIGLFLTLSIVTILQIINPALVNMEGLKMVIVKQEEIVVENDATPDVPVSNPNSAASPSPPNGLDKPFKPAHPLCEHGDGACLKKYCAMSKDERPTATEGMLDPRDGISVPVGSVGIVGNVLARHDTTEAMIRAGKIAHDKEGGPYMIKILGGYRPLSLQIDLVCGDIQAKGGSIANIGVGIAYPGSSNHGTGAAYDLCLLKDEGKGANNPPVTSCETNIAGQYTRNTKEKMAILDQIMAEAGFERYCKETWHYELATAKPGSSPRSTNCPWGGP